MRAFDILGVDPGTDFEEVRKSFRALAKQLHPDVNPGDDEAADEFKKVQAAYDVLKRAESMRQALGDAED